MKKLRRWHKIMLLVLSITILLASGLFGWIYYRKQSLKDVTVKQTNIPTIFVPGYGGNRTSFDGMLDRLDEFDLAKRAYIPYIEENGTIEMDKAAGFTEHNPTIQLLFQANQNPPLEVKQMYAFMQLLKQKYEIKEVNMVGHSTGATMTYDYLIKYSNDDSVPKVNKFVSIAGDFPIKPSSHMLTTGKKLSKDLEVLNIGGNMWDTNGDGMVKMSEVLSLKKLVTGHVKSYELVVINGGFLNAFHLSLHENPDVDKRTIEFLYK